MADSLDIRAALDVLGVSWAFSGSVTEGSEACWNEISWEDEREKPTWAEIQAASSEALWAAQLDQIERTFSERCALLRERQAMIVLLDGVLQETRMAAIRADYQTAKEARQSAIDALMGV